MKINKIELLPISISLLIGMCYEKEKTHRSIYRVIIYPAHQISLCFCTCIKIDLHENT